MIEPLIRSLRETCPESAGATVVAVAATGARRIPRLLPSRPRSRGLRCSWPRAAFTRRVQHIVILTKYRDPAGATRNHGTHFDPSLSPTPAGFDDGTSVAVANDGDAIPVSGERLKKLGQLGDYAVAPGDPDPRGWRVDSSDGRRLGSVADLIVNTQSMEAEYLDVEIDRRLTPGADRARHLVVPTSAVRVGLEERNEQRITITKNAADVVMRMSSVPCRLRALGVNEREWIATGRGACHVRLTRVSSKG